MLRLADIRVFMHTATCFLGDGAAGVEVLGVTASAPVTASNIVAVPKILADIVMWCRTLAWNPQVGIIPARVPDATPLRGISLSVFC